MKPRILVTGGTGFLGKWVVPQLRAWAEVDILTRRDTNDPHAVRGDLSRWNAALDIEDLQKRQYDLCLHMAGLYDLRAAREDCCIHNTFATSVILKVVEELKIPRFMQTSSVAAMINTPLNYVTAGRQEFSRSYPDAYSESKAQCEKILNLWNGTISHRINLRLGVLVGDTEGGRIQRYDGPYHLARALENKRRWIELSPLPLILPGDASIRLPIVPVDAAAKAIGRIAEHLMTASPGLQTLHLTPTEGLSHEQLYTSALKALHIKNKGFRLANFGSRSILPEMFCQLTDLPQEEFYYFMKFPRYDVKPTLELLGDHWCPEFSTYEKAFWRGYENFVSNS